MPLFLWLRNVITCMYLIKKYVMLSVRPGWGGGGEGGTPIYGLYRYVPRNRVWFLRFLVLT